VTSTNEDDVDDDVDDVIDDLLGVADSKPLIERLFPKF